MKQAIYWEIWINNKMVANREYDKDTHPVDAITEYQADLGFWSGFKQPEQRLHSEFMFFEK